MADKVIELLSNDDLRQRLGDQARKKVRDRHDVQIAAPNLYQIIKRFF